MNFRVPDRVHIMPVGYELERVVKSAIGYKADKVILIGHKEDDEKDKERLANIRSALEAEAIEVEQSTCDIFDLYDSLGLMASLIKSFEDEEVYVNVSTGSKVTAIAGMIASMAIDATAYYAKAEDYTGNFPKGIEAVQELPDYHIDAPEQQQIVILHAIRELNTQGLKATKGKLIHMGQQIPLPFMTEIDVKSKGKYRVLDNEIITPLKERNYITTIQDGRHKIAKLTEEGENVLQAFEYLIRQEQKETVKEELNKQISDS